MSSTENPLNASLLSNIPSRYAGPRPTRRRSGGGHDEAGGPRQRPTGSKGSAAQKPAVTFVKAQSACAMPLQSETTPPPAQPRSRLTAQNVNRARPLLLAQSRILVQVATLVVSCWSERP